MPPGRYEFRSTWLFKLLEEVPHPCNQERVHQGHMYMRLHIGNHQQISLEIEKCTKLPLWRCGSVFTEQWASAQLSARSWEPRERSTNKNTGTESGRKAQRPGGTHLAQEKSIYSREERRGRSRTPPWATSLNPGWESCSRNLQIWSTCKICM